MHDSDSVRLVYSSLEIRKYTYRRGQPTINVQMNQLFNDDMKTGDEDGNELNYETSLAPC